MLWDSIYADAKVNRTRMYFGEDYHRRAYESQKLQAEYAKLITETQILGTWDDHDFGLNNAGKEWGHKEFAQRVFLDFLDEPADSPRRKQEGVYAAYTFGETEGRRVQLILTDTRYSRDAIGSDGSILGEKQWAWLEDQLLNQPGDVTLFGSSIQVLADTGVLLEGLVDGVESWGRFPKDKTRLMALIRQSGKRVVLLSGGEPLVFAKN